MVSRWFFLAGTNMLLQFYVVFMTQTLGIADKDQGLWINLTGGSMALVTMISTIPSARLSDRIGRKPVIYAACAIGAVGLLVLGLAPSMPVFILGAVFLGVATGTFLAVDWALMTDIIPKAASGRYMGISNIATASAGSLATVIGGAMLFFVGGAARVPEGPRSIYLVGIVLFFLAGFFLRRVDPRPREVRLADEVVVAAA